MQRSHREKSLPGRGAASSHVGPGAGSVSRGWWGVSPGPYRPGLRSPGVRAGGVRLSRPRCLMAVTGVVAPPSPPRGGGSRKAQAWPRRRQGQVRPAVQTPLPSAVPSWARARPEPPLSKDSAGGCFVSGRRPGADAVHRHDPRGPPASTRLPQVGDGTWRPADQDPWAYAGTSASSWP